MALDSDYDKQWLRTALRKGSDGRIALVTDNSVNPRQLKRFREALRRAGLFDPDAPVLGRYATSLGGWEGCPWAACSPWRQRSTLGAAEEVPVLTISIGRLVAN
jgi:hypothetical protein